MTPKPQDSEQQGGLEWRPIESAPRDGSTVWLRNRQMRQPVQGRWGDYVGPWGSESKEWILVVDPLEWYMPMRRGSLIIPEEFAAIDPLPSPNHLHEGKNDGQ